MTISYVRIVLNICFDKVPHKRLLRKTKHRQNITRWHDQHTSDKVAHYSVYLPRKDERLSWPSWLTNSGRLTHISGHPSAAGRAWDGECLPVKDRCSATVQCSQPRKLGIRGNLLTWIEAWLKNRKQGVVLNGAPLPCSEVVSNVTSRINFGSIIIFDFYK